MSDLPVPKRRKRSSSHRSESHPESSIAGPSKVARNAYNVLPDPSAHKAEYASLKGNLESLKHIDISTFSSKRLNKLSEDDKLSCLILKYGFNVVCTCASGLTQLPTSLPHSYLLNVLSQETGLPPSGVSTLCNILKDHCSNLLAGTVWPKAADLPKMIAPGVDECIQCGSNLVSYHSCNVTCYTFRGPADFTKVTLRCQNCGILYNYSQFGNKNETGFRFYPIQRDYVEVSDTVFFERSLLEFQCCLANHSWVSFEGFTESYNSAFVVGEGKELSPKIVAKAFWKGEVEAELRRLGREDYRFRRDNDLEACMVMIEEIRRQGVYEHPQCYHECKMRGCGELWVTDGIWRLNFPHCMYQVKQHVNGMPTLNLPDVCTETPAHGKAFCTSHCALLEEKAPGVPTGLCDFLKYTGALKSDDDRVDNADPARVETAIALLPTHEAKPGDKSAAQSQGTADLINSHPDIVAVSEVEDSQMELCRKDTGSGRKLRRWSRGHQFIVRGGGHIESWQPLFKSESPSQVLLILLQWLLNRESRQQASNITLAYDNMCNLDKLKAARNPLPLDKPLDQIWMNVEKIIDVFHFKNHRSVRCKEMYCPDSVKQDHPHWNTQCGEQTFSWLHHYEHILCAMPKVHHLFYLHRMVLRRNRYVAKCYQKGKKPNLK